jgi:hypothetical protein
MLISRYAAIAGLVCGQTQPEGKARAGAEGGFAMNYQPGAVRNLPRGGSNSTGSENRCRMNAVTSGDDLGSCD